MFDFIFRIPELLLEYWFITIPVFLLFSLALFALRLHRRKVAIPFWHEASDTLGITFTPPRFMQRFTMEGQVNGCNVRIYESRDNSGDTRSPIYTVVEVDFPHALDFQIWLHRESGLIGTLMKFSGVGDISIGDIEFDDAFIISCEDSIAATTFLTPERRQQLLALDKRFPNVQITDSDIRWKKKGILKNTRTIVDAVNEMSRVACEVKRTESDTVETGNGQQAN